METGQVDHRPRGAARRMSVATLAVSILVGVAALLVGLLGIVYYQDTLHSERARLLAYSSDLADQVAANVSLPVWNLDLEQVERIMMSAMSAREIAEIHLTLPDVSRESIGYVRGPQGGLVSAREEPAQNLLQSLNLFRIDRPVVRKGSVIASLRLYVTEAASLRDLRRTLRAYAWAMAAFCAVLSGCQFFLLWILVLLPIRTVNDFASGVISGGVGSPIRARVPRLLPREIRNLTEQLRAMVELLSSRYEEARASKESAQESEARYRNIFHRSPVSLWEEDISGLRTELSALRKAGIEDLARYMDEHPDFVRRAVSSIVVLDVNDATLRLYGVKRREQLLGPLDLTLDPAAVAEFRQQILAISEGKDQWERESTASSMDGRVISILTSVSIPSPQDANQRMLVNVLDISERRKIEKALRESEMRYRTYIDNSSEGIVRWELHQPIPVTLAEDEQLDRMYEHAYAAECNASAAAIYGIESIPGFLGGNLDRVFPHSEPSYVEMLRGFVRAGYRLVGAEPSRGDKEMLYVRLNLTGVIEDGALVRIWCVIQDVGAVKRAEREKRILEERLQQSQKMEAIGQLAGGIAHDFNNILAAILMNIELLQQDPEVSTDTHEALQELMADANRAASLTRQLLMFSRRSVLDTRVLNLNDVVSNLLKMIGRLLGEDVEIEFKQKGSLPSIEADVGMIEQVIMNLAVNSRDAMVNGGRITLGTAEVEIDEKSAAENPNRRTGCFVCLSVSDTGHGMDRATLDRVFEPFFTTKAEGKGTGLGLATVYGIIAQHKGWVEVESDVGRGTIFRVFFPPSTREIPTAAGTHARTVPRGKESLLVVEDDRSVRLLAVRSLVALGYHVFEARNGLEALALWEKHGNEIDLVLTDMVMPEGMTGMELAEKLRAMSPAVRIIVSSGYSLELAHQGTPTAHGIVYLPKPYQMITLGETVRRCLDNAF
jgi:signal transduction histidine kinase